MDKYHLLKLDASYSIFAIYYCQSTHTICMGRSSFDGPFFFVYSCLFSGLHVALPFDDFTMSVLQTLNVAPSQLHPNTWASLQAFRLMCDLLRLCLLFPPSCIITHRTRPTQLVGYPLSIDQVVFFFPPSQPLTKISRENSLNFYRARG